MNILLIETATPVCAVALYRDGADPIQRISTEPNAHSSKLSPFINEVLAQAALHATDLQGVCVSSGPGSYTGLRIGVSTAKGLCYAASIPLLSVPTLQSMATLYYLQHPDYHGLVCPMIDARRMECYTAIYDPHLTALKETSADIIVPGIYDRYLDQHTIVFIGDGAEKTRPLLASNSNARYDTTFVISALGMYPQAQQRLLEHQIEDTAYFEPFYLKDFVAKKSVVKGLH